MTLFHEEYLANTVATIKYLLFVNFEQNYQIKDEPYEYKNEEILYQERIVSEDEAYSKLIKYISEGGNLKFGPVKELVSPDQYTVEQTLPKMVRRYSVYRDGKTLELSKEFQALQSLTNTEPKRVVLSFVEYPESWLFTFKKSQIGFKGINSQNVYLLKIFNREFTKKGMEAGESFYQIKITKSGFVRYYNGQRCSYLSLRNWHNTKLPLPLEVLKLLISINPSNEWIRTREDFPHSRFDISNKELRKISNWKKFYQFYTGAPYKETLPISIVKAVSKKVPAQQLEYFLSRVEKHPLLVAKIEKERPPFDRWDESFEKVYSGLIGIKDSSTWLVGDCIRMARDLGEELNLRIESEKKFTEYHDNLAKRHALRSTPPLKTHEKYKFLKSNETYQVELIDEAERLVQESVELRHCVSSYASRINSGYCAIYSIWDGKERWTLELIYDRNWTLEDMTKELSSRDVSPTFQIAQCRGFANKAAPNEVVEFIQKQLDEVNPALYKTYLQQRLGELRNVA